MEGGANAAVSGESSAPTGVADLPIPTGEAGPFAVVAWKAHRVCRNQFGADCYRPKHVRGDVLGVRNG